MNFTIYTLGDIPTFTAVLNAVAMVFQSGMMTGPGLGLGAAAGLGLLVSLGVLLLVGGAIAMFQGGGGGPGNWAMLLVLVLVYSVATQKVDLQIEDYYTGTATTVANVPFGVAVPGAIISSITRSVANKMEVGFSTVDGNYISLSSDGFASPLQLMLSMRGGKYALLDADPFLTANIKIFVLDCVVGRPGFSPNAFAKQNVPGTNNPIAYITTPGVYGGGLTVIFSEANTAGIGSACADAATNIKNKMDAFVGPGITSAMSAFINANMNKRASPNTVVSNKYTADDIVEVHNKMINGVWGSSQTAQDFMITALASSTISNAYNCGLSNSSYATYNQCTMTMTQSMEQWKIDAAGGATGFSKAMMPAMNILLAMFFGFAPLMFVFMMMAGAQGLGILVKYMFFGIWCQTWLPFAVVINYIGEVMVKSEFLRLAAAAPDGLNPATVPAFYDALSVKLAVISDMLAAVPLISMALLSGSIYGLTKIASNMGKDKVDEKGAAPNVQETGAVTKVGPAMNVGSRREGNANLGSSEAAGQEGVQIRLGEQNSSMMSSAHQRTAQSLKSVSEGLNQQLSVSGSNTKAIAALGQTAKDFSATHEDAATFSKSIADKLTHGQSYTDAERLAIEGAADLSLLGSGSSIMAAKAASDAANSIAKARPAALNMQGKGGVSLSGGRTISQDEKTAQNHEEAAQNAVASKDAVSKSLKGSLSQSITTGAGWQAIKSLGGTVGTSASETEQFANTESSLASSGVSRDASFQRSIPGMVKDMETNPAARGLALDAYNANGGAVAGERALERFGASKTDYGSQENRRLAMGVALLESGQSGVAPNSTKEGLSAALYGGKPSEAEGAGALKQKVSARTDAVHGAVAPIADVKPGAASALNDQKPALAPANAVSLNKNALPKTLAPDADQVALASMYGTPGAGVSTATPTLSTHAGEERAAELDQLKKYASGQAAAGGGLAGRMAKDFVEKVVKNPAVIAGEAAVATGLVAQAVDALTSGSGGPEKSGSPGRKGAPMSDGAKHLLGSASTAAGAATVMGSITDMMKNGADGDNSFRGVAGALMMTPNPVAKTIGASLLGGYEAAKWLGADKAGALIGGALYDFTHGAGSESERATKFQAAMNNIPKEPTQQQSGAPATTGQHVGGSAPAQTRADNSVAQHPATVASMATGVHAPASVSAATGGQHVTAAAAPAVEPRQALQPAAEAVAPPAQAASEQRHLATTPEGAGVGHAARQSVDGMVAANVVPEESRAAVQHGIISEPGSVAGLSQSDISAIASQVAAGPAGLAGADGKAGVDGKAGETMHATAPLTPAPENKTTETVRVMADANAGSSIHETNAQPGNGMVVPGVKKVV